MIEQQIRPKVALTVMRTHLMSLSLNSMFDQLELLGMTVEPHLMKEKK